MAKNITLMGADYPNVPAVQLPQTGGGVATFYDIELKRVLLTVNGLSISSDGGWVKLCNFSDIDNGITSYAQIVSIQYYSSNADYGMTYELYSDGIYVFSPKAFSNKWIKTLITYTPDAPTVTTKTIGS